MSANANTGGVGAATPPEVCLATVPSNLLNFPPVRRPVPHCRARPRHARPAPRAPRRPLLHSKVPVVLGEAHLPPYRTTTYYAVTFQGTMGRPASL